MFERNPLKLSLTVFFIYIFSEATIGHDPATLSGSNLLDTELASTRVGESPRGHPRSDFDGGFRKAQEHIHGG